MLGWQSKAALSLLSDRPSPTGLIDHRDLAEPKLTWDGRKGQWVPISYSYTFPKSAFEHVLVANGQTCARELASFSFPPSKRHMVMLDQGSPRLRILPRTTLSGRNPLLPYQVKSVSRSPLAKRMRLGDGDYETDYEERTFEPVDPFNLDARPAKPMPWLDDIDIEEFLSSALDYQQNERIDFHCITMSEPVYPMNAKPRKSSPCTPSSPPPPLFLDNDSPIPLFRPSPPRL